MSILQLLAIVLCVACVVLALVQLKRGEWRSVVVFLVSAGLSIVLVFLAATMNADILAAAKLQGQPAEPGADAVVADNSQNKPGDAVDEVNPEVGDAPEDTAVAENHGADDVPETPNTAENADDAGELNFGDMDDAPDNAQKADNIADADNAADSKNAQNADNAQDAAVADAPEEPDPLAPKANAGNNVSNIKVREAVQFDGKKSKKNKASIASYHWDFGDGASSDEMRTSHAYAQPGTYTVTLTVTDKDGHKGTAQRTVDVNRPESKVRFVDRKLSDAVVKKPLDDLTGTFTKKYSGSKTVLEAEAEIVSSEGCTCTIQVELNGPGCSAKQAKNVKDGGEGQLSIKASCHGELGEYTWAFRRLTGNACECSFRDVTIDGYEN